MGEEANLVNAGAIKWHRNLSAFVWAQAPAMNQCACVVRTGATTPRQDQSQVCDPPQQFENFMFDLLLSQK